jgi:hypothetical protein
MFAPVDLADSRGIDEDRALLGELASPGLRWRFAGAPIAARQRMLTPVRVFDYQELTPVPDGNERSLAGPGASHRPISAKHTMRDDEAELKAAIERRGM